MLIVLVPMVPMLPSICNFVFRVGKFDRSETGESTWTKPRRGSVRGRWCGRSPSAS